QQRKVIYAERRRVLAGENLREQVEHMLADVVGAYIDGATSDGYAEDWDLDALWIALGTLYPISIRWQDLVEAADHDDDAFGEPIELTRDLILEAVVADAHEAYQRREAEIDEVIPAQGGMRELERQILLTVLDRKWREHLYEMDYLKEGIGLRAMAQRDPLIEYQREGFDMFAAMMDGIKEEAVGYLFNVQVAPVEATTRPGMELESSDATEPASPARPAAASGVANGSASGSGVGAESGSGGAESGSDGTVRAAGTIGGEVGAGAAPAPGAGAPTGKRGRHATPAYDPADPPTDPAMKVPAALRGVGRATDTSALRYSGPAEDGTQTRQGDGRSGGGTAGGSAAEPSRNQPCPCGSGRKYKHCHGARTGARG
ncbi:MAG TPA: SEC-C metal-binding domain-containing protein, partial [Pseudonocardia sp.]|nr:SEC-C metal-binding domain-containing protein [Pseudonocardia sp.]